MRYRLRTLLIVLGLGPPLLAGALSIGWYLQQRQGHAPPTKEELNRQFEELSRRESNT